MVLTGTAAVVVIVIGLSIWVISSISDGVKKVRGRDERSQARQAFFADSEPDSTME